MKRGTWVNSFTGRKIRPLHPYREMFSLKDIAHHLSQICRYTGATREPYSVAQHSILVAIRAGELARKACKTKKERIKIMRWGLIHDASEAYLLDLANPVKITDRYEMYRKDEKRIMRAVCRWLKLPEKEPDEVKQADKEMLAIEVRDCIENVHPDWYKECPSLRTPYTAERIEIATHAEAKEAFLGAAKILGLKCS